ncbi:MAG TPA: hypothetical protein VK148_07990 [Xanthobacteraceae bacterium]|nr:hypothetical protein [Xanthobacteraceae bacterium]
MSAERQQSQPDWRAPDTWSREQVVAASDDVLARPAGAVLQAEDIFRLSALGLDWDIGVRVYVPQPDMGIARGADGKRVGIFLLHGGAGDYKSMERFALLFAEKFGFKVVTMTFPGRLYLDDESRDWPGDTMKPDGSVRTPIWLRGEYVTPDQYVLVKDAGKRMKYGTRTSARAKLGTRFYDRMASWPVAFEEGMKEACRRHFPAGEFSIYVHGHSTGGPYVSMLSQRVANIAGVIAIENSTFGFINEKKHQWGGHVGKIEGYQAVAPKSAESWKDPFNDLYIRTWRDLARYRGSEALGQEGPQALMRLPWLMEEVLEAWDVARKRPQFKAEYMITHNIVGALEQAARAAATRLKMSPEETDRLVARYLGYARPLSRAGVKPVPPFLFVIAKDSRDHSPEVYREVIIPMFRAMEPAPRVHVTRFGAGVHTYTKPEPGLPVGITPAAAQFYHDAITGGYFVV